MIIPIVLSSTRIDNVEFTASLPARGTDGAAGYDLCAYLPTGTFTTRVVGADMSSENGVKTATVSEIKTGSTSIPVGGRALIPTGLKMTIPTGWYGRIAPRSGLAWKNGIDVLAGVIDADYTGDVGVILINQGNSAFVVNHGDRIAQIIIEQCATAKFHTCGELGASSRGAGGYGSTGTAALASHTIQLNQGEPALLRGGPPRGAFRLNMGADGVYTASAVAPIGVFPGSTEMNDLVRDTHLQNMAAMSQTD